MAEHLTIDSNVKRILQTNEWYNDDWFTNAPIEMILNKMKYGSLMLETIRLREYRKTQRLLKLLHDRIQEDISIKLDVDSTFIIESMYMRANYKLDKELYKKLQENCLVLKDATSSDLPVPILDQFNLFLLLDQDLAMVEESEELKSIGEKIEEQFATIQEQHPYFEAYLSNLIQYNILIKDLFINAGAHTSVISQAEKLLEIGKKYNMPFLIGSSLQSISFAHEAMGQLDKAFNYQKEVVELYETTGIGNRTLSIAYMNLGANCGNIGKLEEGLKYFQKSIDIDTELGYNDFNLAANYLNQGNLYSDLGRMEDTIKTTKEALRIFEQIENPRGISFSYINISKAYLDLGNITDAIEYAKKAIVILQTIDEPLNLAETYDNLVVCYSRLGKLDEALYYGHLALDTYDSIEDPHVIDLSYLSIGEVYIMLSQYDEAQKYFNLSYEEAITTGSPTRIVTALANLIHIEIILDDLELANKYYNEMVETVKKTESEISKLNVQLVEALILTKSDRMRDIWKGETILENIIKDISVDFGIEVKAIQFLLPILLDEFRLTGNGVVLDEIHHYVSTMKKLAEKHGLRPTIIQCDLIDIELNLINNNLKNALSILESTVSRVKEYNLGNLQYIIEQKAQQIKEDLDVWKTLESLNLPLNKKIKLSIVNHYLDNAQNLATTSLGQIQFSGLKEDKIFSALSHHLRRDIINKLYSSPSITFTKLMEYTGLRSGSIANHLKNLEPFVEKNDDQSYSLSVEGRRLAIWLYGDKGVKVEDLRFESYVGKP